MKKQDKNEAQKIVDRYLRDDTSATLYGNIDEKIIPELLNNLGNFERPDMITYYSNHIIGIEHFEFDSSRTVRKGSKYQIENAKITNKFDKVVESDLADKKEIIIHNDIKVETSIDNYYNNFKIQFENHYKNIDKYIDNIRTRFNSKDKDISIWLFVEDTSPLGSYYFTKEREIRLMHPLYSKENLELFNNSSKVSGLIFGSYSGKKYKLFIICNDNDSIQKFRNDLPVINKSDFFNFEPHTTAFACLVPNDEIKGVEEND